MNGKEEPSIGGVLVGGRWGSRKGRCSAGNNRVSFGRVVILKAFGKRFKSDWISQSFEVGPIRAFQSSQASYAGESISTDNIQTTKEWNLTEAYTSSQLALNPRRQTYS